MRWVGWCLATLGTLLLLVGLGPRPTCDEPDPRSIAAAVPDAPVDIERWLAAREAAVEGLRPDNEARIRWSGAPGSRAPLAIVVLHGFSASPRSLYPLPDEVADDVGAHVVYARLRGHGLDGESLAAPSGTAWLADAEEAWVIGTRLAERVVLLGSSTGGTAALWLALRHRNDPRLAGTITLSANLGITNTAGELLVQPWVKTLILPFVPERCIDVQNEAQPRYWTECYPTRSVVHMMGMVEHVRRKPLERIRAPQLFVFNPDDPVVDAARIARLAERVPGAEVHRFTPHPDESRHVLAGDVLSPNGTRSLRPILSAWVSALSR